MSLSQTFNFNKVNESRYKQSGVTLHFSTGPNLLKRILRKDKYGDNQLRKPFSTGQNLLKKNIKKR